MPFMERITWTGISLHAGVLPGYPASHGCVRMPEQFAYQLYQVSKLGMRVILVRDDIAPVEVAQPPMFTAWPASLAETPRPGEEPGQPEVRGGRCGHAAVQGFEARGYEKVCRAATAERVPDRRSGSCQRAGRVDCGRTRGRNRHFAGAHPAGGSRQNSSRDPGRGRAGQTRCGKGRGTSEGEASAKAEQELQAAAAETAKAHDAAEEAKLDLSPVSVFISRKTQRLYIRKNNMPVFEAPVTISGADKPIGSFVFTALDNNGASGTMRWNVVSMYKDAANVEPAEPAAKGKAKVSHAEASPANVAGAQAALGRITVTPESQERISAAVLPGSSLIISDEGPHNETGKDTDFIVIMSGEPKAALLRGTNPEPRDEWQDSFFGGFSSHESRGRRGGGGSGGGWFFLE